MEPELVDFRSAPAASPEGSGNAKAAWEHYHLDLARDLTEEAFSLRSRAALPEDARDELLAAVIEESELLGFWLAWWRAGGFAGLERAGWNRATIFRRLRRFRSNFGAHPDDYQPGWITLDLHATWEAALRRRIEPGPDADL